MVALARQRIVSPNVTFHCEAAEHLSRVPQTTVDRVLCNAAFWQLDQERVLPEIAQVLKPSGKCVISIPKGFASVDEPDVLYEKHRLLWMILEEMSIRGFKIGRAAARVSRERPTVSREDDTATLERANLRVERIETVAADCAPVDYLEFLRIPVMIQRFSASLGVPEDAIGDILQVVASQMAWVDVRVPPQEWKVIVLTKTAV